MATWLTVKGNWNKTVSWLNRVHNFSAYAALDAFGAQGVAALEAATPKDSGVTAGSWYYEIVDGPTLRIIWCNNSMNDGFNIAVGLQYGHGVEGGYVEGIDYINPSLRPVFEDIADQVWRTIHGDS